MVKHFGVTPYLVFDGDFLPSKGRTEASRGSRREESKKVGLEFLKAGKPSQAQQELQKAIDVTPEMARHLIEELKKEGVPYVVAPYEADAQLVYLERIGVINGIISEDSDLLVFGAKRLLTKMDPYGQCIEINRKDFCAVREISLTGWTDDQFRQMAIFSGCDYLEGVGNMGLKTAYRMMRKYKTPERVIRMLQFDGKFKISENYLAQYKQAELTFIYQRVFCPKKQEIVLLTEPDPSSTLDIEEMPYIGGRVDPELAKAIAVGDVNPISKEPITLVALPDKRNTNTSTPTRAAVAVPRQSRQLPAKPIDSYFNGHRRIPMGEMDRNCFSVDPKRVAALTQNGLTPRVFPLPRPYLDADASPAPRIYRRRTEPVSRAFSTLDPLVNPALPRQRTNVSARRISDVDSRPPKKARLCEDDTVDETQNRQPERSKFFLATKPVTRICESTILMSDDSIEEALADLPDIGDGWQVTKATKEQQTLHIFQDEPSTSVEEAEPKDDDITQKNLAKAHEVSYDTGDILEKETENVEDKTSGKQLHGLLKEFSYTPSVPKTSNRTRMVFGLPTPSSSTQGSETKPLPATPSETPLRTPLQRMGAAALQRNRASFSPSVKAKSTSRAPKKRTSLAESLDNFPINPAFVPLPKVDLAEVEALNKSGGSEDQIIPDSDEENDPPIEMTAHDSRRRLDLSRFVYA